MQESSDNMSANNDLLLKHRRTHDVSTTTLEYNGNVTLLSEPRPYPNMAPTKKRRRCAAIGACFKSFLPGACFGGLVVYISLNQSDAINANTKSALSDITQMRQRSENFYDLRPEHIRRKQDGQQKMTSEQRQQKQLLKKNSSYNKHHPNSDVELPVSAAPGQQRWQRSKYTLDSFVVAGVNLAGYGFGDEAQEASPKEPFALYEDFDIGQKMRGDKDGGSCKITSAIRVRTTLL